MEAGRAVSLDSPLMGKLTVAQEKRRVWGNVFLEDSLSSLVVFQGRRFLFFKGKKTFKDNVTSRWTVLTVAKTLGTVLKEL